MAIKQKVWLYVFLAMFVIPEALWSPVGNFVYQLFQTSKSGGTYPFRDNFLQDTSNANSYSIVLFLQFLGLLMSALYLIVLNKSFKNKWLLLAPEIILLLASVVVFYLFGFSIKLRSFGF